MPIFSPNWRRGGVMVSTVTSQQEKGPGLNFFQLSSGHVASLCLPVSPLLNTAVLS